VKENDSVSFIADFLQDETNKAWNRSKQNQITKIF